MYRDPRKILREHKLHPKHAWGQNFLIAAEKVERIVSLLDARPGDRVLELGAGTGVLTHMLLSLAPQATLFALERDRELVTLLEAEFAQSPVTILAEDAARFPLDSLPTGGDLRILGNLPYQISSPILFHLLAQRHLWKRAILMLQKEVVARLIAKPQDGKDYSILSIRFGMFFDVTRVLVVPRRCFHPQPKVDSAVVRLEPLPQPRFPLDDEKSFARVVKAAFANRRKTLLNALHAAFHEIDKDALPPLLLDLQIDPQRRGESLNLEEFARLTNALHPLLPQREATEEGEGNDENDDN